MKLIFILIAVLFFSKILCGQEQIQSDPHSMGYTIHSEGDASISLSGNRLLNNPYESLFAGGFKMRMFVGKRISIDADLVIGENYIHWGPGIIGIPIWLLGNKFFNLDEDLSNGAGLFGFVMMILSAEHIAYHFPLKSTTDISPFVSFLRINNFNIYNLNTETEEYFSHVNFVAGVEVNKYFKRFVLSPYIEYNIAYDGNFHGFNFGVNFGYYIPEKQ